ncbi:MAG: hypothetical protein LBL75_00490 [Rickettsiales bacterium]|jgi:hypothetical protein|nr:hypothetical protein [Rickettsiales bacterium]
MNTLDFLLFQYKPYDNLEKDDLEKLRLFSEHYKKTLYDRLPNQPVITASAMVVNPDFTKILVMHHKLHGFYKQFGGHADGNPNLAAVANNELFEESGAKGKLLDTNPFDLIRWNFPDRNKNGIFYPAHDCFDIAFLFIMDEQIKLNPNKNEVLDTKWIYLEMWRDYSDDNNPTYKSNPQNYDYQQRIYNKIKQRLALNSNLPQI